MGNFNNKIRNLENQVTTMRETISNDNNLHSTEIQKLATVIDDHTGHIKDQNKVIQSIESKTGNMTAPLENLNTAIYYLERSINELLNKTRHEESKDCPSEMGKVFLYSV